MAKPNLSSILDRPSEDAERPKPLPQGSYTAVVQSWDEGVSTKKQTPYIHFVFAILAAGEDVDEEELEAVGGIADRTISTTFYLSDKSEYRLREFLDNCGVASKEGKNKLSHRERAEMSINAQVGIFLKHTPTQDGKGVYADVDRTYSVE